MDIDRKYTELVAEFFAKGYRLHTKSMSGSQGEEAKIDFIKDNELIRVWMDRKYEFDWDSELSGYTLFIRVGRWNEDAKYAGRRIVWLHDLDVIEEYKFYQIDCDTDWYEEDIEVAKAIQQKRNKRIRNRLSKKVPIKSLSSLAAKEIGKEFIKRTRGYQRVSTDKIEIRKEFRFGRLCYYVNYNGTSSCIF